MAWFGESLANIKGQISSFTKEVLTADAEDEDDGAAVIDPDDFKRLKAEVTRLKEAYAHQREEVIRLKSQEDDLKEQCNAGDRKYKTAIESYQQLLKSNEEENDQLREHLKRLESVSKDIEAKRNEVEESISSSEVLLLQQVEEISLPVEKSDASTETEVQTYDDVFVKELEERCNSYQNELFVIRNELISLQRNTDLAEEKNAKFIEDLSEMLQAEFLQGETISKLNFEEFLNQDRSSLILSTIKEISILWKDSIEKKEKSIISISKSHSSSSAYEKEETIEKPPHSPSSNITDLFNEPFFPSKVDSYGLETILEEERSEEDVGQRSDSADLLSDEAIGGGSIGAQNKRKRTPSPATTIFSSNCSTQTEEAEDELSEEPTSDIIPASTESTASNQAVELALLQARAEKWSQDEAELISKLEEREDRIRRLELDLGRLRSHLVDLEEQTTTEAILSEKREEELRGQIIQLKNELSQTLQQNERSLDVREEITKLTQERNSYRIANSNLEDQIQKLNAQLQNLNFVLEDFQREKEVEVSKVEKRLRLEMRQLEEKNEVLRRELEKEETLLERAKSGLDAAHQLNAQIEEKTRAILQLKTQVQERDDEMTKLKSQMSEFANNLDGKIDRYLIKNLIVGYFSTPVDKRSEVLRVLATVLDFNREDRQKTGLETGSSIWQFGRRASSSSEKEKQSESLSEAFIHFLENESKPKVELRMSVEEVTRRKSRATDSPSTVLMNSGRESPASVGSSVEGNSASHSGISEISMSLPVLSQADRSNSILKDILNPKP